jgi:hypothetical protein
VSVVLYTPGGAVIPPRDQVDALAAIDPRLVLRFHEGLSCFVVALLWAADDPRRGADAWAVETGHDWSIECQIPPNVPLEEMASWALRKMERGGGAGAAMVAAHHAAIERANAAQTVAIADGVLHDVLDTVNVDAPTVNVGRRRTRVA